MVLALEGDSTMTSLVPWPLPAAALALVVPALLPPLLLAVLALAAVAAFVLVVSVLAGNALPVFASRRDRPTVPVVTRRPSAETISPARCVP